jgi:hypothetical protein
MAAEDISPYAFTEQGVAMLSSVLNSDRAVEVNIQIIRVFVNLRAMIASNKELAKRLDELEKKYDDQFRVVFDAIHELMIPPDEDKRKIGFLAKESRALYKSSDGEMASGILEKIPLVKSGKLRCDVYKELKDGWEEAYVH